FVLASVGILVLIDQQVLNSLLPTSTNFFIGF
ncbi:hypothetical protein VSAK1_12767, partial [Vibrio mediterranei AK1]